MKVALFNQYGSVDVLQIADVPKPDLRANYVSVKVHAAAINPKDNIYSQRTF